MAHLEFGAYTYQVHPVWVCWTTLHYLGMSSGHPLDGPGTGILLGILGPSGNRRRLQVSPVASGHSPRVAVDL